MYVTSYESGPNYFVGLCRLICIYSVTKVLACLRGLVLFYHRYLLSVGGRIWSKSFHNLLKFSHFQKRAQWNVHNCTKSIVCFSHAQKKRFFLDWFPIEYILWLVSDLTLFFTNDISPTCTNNLHRRCLKTFSYRVLHEIFTHCFFVVFSFEWFIVLGGCMYICPYYSDWRHWYWSNHMFFPVTS